MAVGRGVAVGVGSVVGIKVGVGAVVGIKVGVGAVVGGAAKPGADRSRGVGGMGCSAES